MGNGFPGLAIVSLVALLAALALVAVVSLQPWAANSVTPHLRIAPEPRIALGDSVAVVPGRRVAVATARPAGAGAQTFVADKVESGGAAPRPVVGIASAHAVASPGPGHPATGSPSPPQPDPLPAQQPPQAPVATPVSAPVASPSPEPVAAAPATRPASGIGSHPGPGTAGGPGPIAGEVSGPVPIQEGDEYAFSFSFYIEPSAYRAPGEDNLIVRFLDEANESYSFGLQLWDDGSGAQRGLWASGDAMGGERFLAPLAERAWHQVVVDFEASSDGDGLYLLLLDGKPIDARAWVSLIEPGSSEALLDAGLVRDGERVAGASDIYFGPMLLGETLESVIP